MDGGGDFNEVFFDNARTAASNIVGGRGEGWQVSRSTLKHERNIIGNPNLMRDRFAALLKLARESERKGRPALEDTSVRQRLAEIEARMRVAETARMRMLTAEAKGDPVGAGLWPLMAKLYATDTEARIVELAYDTIGADGLLAPPIRPLEPGARSKQDWVHQYIASLGTRLGGGSSNIQRNIIGERGLGLPRDPRPAK
jgi:alkylation response protein AidB-like acyl-CoA dehydrogenase